MAAPTFVTAGTFVSGTGGVSPGVPSGTTTDDIMLMLLATDGDNVTPPSGWAHVTGSPVFANGQVEITLLWKRAGGSETAPSVADPGTEVLARTFSFRGCISSGNPWDVVGTATQSDLSNSISIPGVTTTVADTLLCMFQAVSCSVGDSPTMTVTGWANGSLTSVTERGDNYADPDGSGAFEQIALCTGVKSTTGATGTTTATLSANTTARGYIVVALKSGSAPTNAAGGNATATNATNAAKSVVGAKAEGIG